MVQPYRQRQRCRARSSRTGEPCQAWAITGGAVCVAHGGRAPRVVVAAAERRLDVKVRQTLARLDGPEAVEDPLTELTKLAGEVLAWKDAIAGKVNELTEIRYAASGPGTEQLRAEIALFERAMDRCMQVLGLMARLDIDGRLAKIDERRADILIEALNAGLAAAGVSGEAAVEARHAAARVIRAAA